MPYNFSNAMLLTTDTQTGRPVVSRSRVQGYLDDIAAALNALDGTVTFDPESKTFETEIAAAAATIDASVDIIETRGESSPGVGRSARFLKTNRVATPFGFESADGAAWAGIPDPHGDPVADLVAPSYTARTPGASDPNIITTIGSTLYGVDAGTIYQKTAESVAWSSVTAAPGGASTIPLMFLADDGEVIVVTSTQIYRSIGWGTGSVTWTLKVTNSGGSAVFLGFGGNASSDGTKMIVGEYATGTAGAGWEDSVKAWASQDGGDTWSVVYDSSVQHPSDYTSTHIHGCAYDEWQDIWLVVEGHTTEMGIYWSADPFSDPTDWTRIEAGPMGETLVEGQPTCLVPVEGGIVCASDAPSQGIWVIERGEDPADMQVHWLYEWPAGRGGTLGFGQCYAVDPETGVVYMGYTHNAVAGSYNPLAIFASDGRGGGIVWEGDASTVPAASTNIVLRIAVTPWRTVEAQTSSTSEVGAKNIRGRISRHRGIRYGDDAGGVLGGRRTTTSGSTRSTAVGQGAHSGDLSLAVGSNAGATPDSSVAVGVSSAATGVNSVAIGHSAVAEISAVAIGKGIKASANSIVIGSNSRDLSALDGVVSIGAVQTVSVVNAVAVGQSVTVSANGVAVGAFSTNSGASGTAVGTSASNSQTSGTAIGASAVNTGVQGVAVGQAANCGHTGSVALGQGSTTTRLAQVHIGPRHVEQTKVASDPSAPGANNGQTFWRLNGSSKMEFCAQAPSGGISVLYVEP